MTHEDKQLLLKDLCARLPYGVFADVEWDDGYRRDKIELRTRVISDLICDEIKSIKPYLRPISSMTEEEDTYYWEVVNEDAAIEGLGPHEIPTIAQLGESMSTVIDWLNAHHFDYRGLIEKGLALEAPSNMYKAE